MRDADAVTNAPLVQCESCGDHVRETTCEFEDVPGARLAFCPDCRGPSNREAF